MVTFSTLGSMGWLGNQLFQYAALIGLREKGLEIGIPSGAYELLRVFTISAPKVTVFPQLCFNQSFGYTDLDVPDNTDLMGYFQSERYFEHCRGAVRDGLTFAFDVYEAASRLYKDVPTVALHVRRGNYALNPDVHPILDGDYYMEALSLIPEGTRILVFSDDIGWCKKHFDGVDFSEGNSAGVDLALMSMCDHFVIANSSYSWWGAWLGEKPHSIVVAPKRWFGRNGPDDTDLVPSRWTRC